MPNDLDQLCELVRDILKADELPPVPLTWTTPEDTEHYGARIVEGWADPGELRWQYTAGQESVVITHKDGKPLSIGLSTAILNALRTQPHAFGFRHEDSHLLSSQIPAAKAAQDRLAQVHQVLVNKS